VSVKDRIISIHLLERQQEHPLYVDELGIIARMRTKENYGTITEHGSAREGNQNDENKEI
jgi:hypothetical protein